jgi:pimeloyl-ACP methyl ester carboxylesterase
MRVDIGGGVRLFFDVAGSSLEPTDEEMVPRPTLLLLHGGPGFDHSGFRPYFDRFADTHQVVYLDHRGMGRSDARDDDSGWDLDTWADDIVRFCDALGIEHPVVFGNSFGGFVAMHHAARHPDHPAAVVLSSTLARRHTEVSAARFEALGGAEARAAYERIYVHNELSTEAWIDYMAICLPLYNVQPSPFGDRRTWMNVRVLFHFQDTFTGLDLRPDLEAIRRPTLVLVGEDDPMTPVEAAEDMLVHLPEGVGRLERFDSCGHGTFRDQPEPTEQVLRAFLRDLPS